MFKFLGKQFRTPPRTRRDPSGRRGDRAGARCIRGQRPRLERLEDRLAPASYYWHGDVGFLWSSPQNWTNDSGDHIAPYGDPSAALIFDPASRLYTEHDFTSPTTIQSIEFLYSDGAEESDGYYLGARPGAAVITLKGDITSRMTGGLSTIGLPLDFSIDEHAVNVMGDDTIELVGNGNLSGSGIIRKVGSGTLDMRGDHRSFQGFIDVVAGTLLDNSAYGLGNDESIAVEEGAVLDLKESTTLHLLDPRGEIRLSYGDLTLNGHIIHIFGDINGPGGLTLTGNTRVTLDGTQTYTGRTQLLSGKLEIDGSSARSPITISAGAGLYGRGTTGALTVAGLVSPGDVPGETIYQHGVLQCNGDVNFLPKSSFAADISGFNPAGRGYDQLNVNGRVDLSGSPKLNVSLGFASKPGDSFTILTSTGGITGTFAGLPDGANFGISGTPMQIHYTGNSVVLTHRLQFAPPVPYAAGSGPTLMATGDFRGQGILDLVTANGYDGSVNVLLGNGDGTFQAGVRYAASQFPTSLTVGDFNGDGHLDLLTTTDAYGIPTMSLLLGNGDGTFQDAVTSPLDQQAFAVASADLRGNGILDLVTANGYDRSVSVLLGNGDGTFQPAVTYPVGSFAGVVALTDLNGDGKLDLVLSKIFSVSVLLGNGDDTFQPAQDVPTSGYTSIAFGDFDGDHKLDLIGTANSAFDSSVYLMLGNSDGTFGTPTRIFSTDQPDNVAVGDFDGDGALDFVVTTGYPSNRGVALVYGQGDGTFRAPSYYYPGQGFSSLVAGSFQGSRFPDLAVINANPVTGTTEVSVLLNVGDGTPPPAPPPGGSGQRNGPHAPTEFRPADSFLQTGAVDAALQTWSSSPRAPSGAIPSPWPGTPRLEVAGVERFFAAATEQDQGFAWPRSKRAGLLGANDGWLDELGLGNLLVGRPILALPSA